MEYFEKKLTYLRGLCDGTGFDKETPEGKIFHHIFEVLDDMAFMLETFMDDDDLDDIEITHISDMTEDYHVYNCPNCEAEIDVIGEDLADKSDFPCPFCNGTVPITVIK